MNTTKQRHGCLTAYLIYLLLSLIGSLLTYSLAGNLVMSQFPDSPSWSIPVLITGSVIMLCLVVGLFLWKKWAFWGFVVMAIVFFGINMMVGLSVWQALLGLVGAPLLYGVLQIGKENKGWPQLE